MVRDYDTALRPHLQKRLEEIREADILVGIPCYNNEDTIVHVIQTVSHGIYEHYRDRRAVIMVADGGSTDDTRDVVQDFQLRPWQEKIVTIYRGVGGKGTALRAIFEAAYRLKVRACACSPPPRRRRQRTIAPRQRVPSWINATASVRSRTVMPRRTTSESTAYSAACPVPAAA